MPVSGNVGEDDQGWHECGPSQLLSWHTRGEYCFCPSIGTTHLNVEAGMD